MERPRLAAEPVRETRTLGGGNGKFCKTTSLRPSRGDIGIAHEIKAIWMINGATQGDRKKPEE